MCTRSTYRFIEHYEKYPKIIGLIQKYTPFFKSGHVNPRVEAEFTFPVRKLEMGCGYMNVLDDTNRIYTWGDNYGS